MTFRIDDVRSLVSRTSGGEAAAPIRDPVLKKEIEPLRG
jgi:hypothetical protein